MKSFSCITGDTNTTDKEKQIGIVAEGNAECKAKEWVRTNASGVGHACVCMWPFLHYQPSLSIEKLTFPVKKLFCIWKALQLYPPFPFHYPHAILWRNTISEAHLLQSQVPGAFDPLPVLSQATLGSDSITFSPS